MNVEEHMVELRKVSGDVYSKKHHRLAGFLYELMRDHLPAGKVEGILLNILEGFPNEEIRFTNGWLAKYAIHIADRLMEKKP